MSLSLTFISDTHNRHKQITDRLPGGDVIFHTGDISSQGYEYEVRNFLKWFSELPYERKIFIAGNHDLGFETNPEYYAQIVSEYDVEYLQDSSTKIGKFSVYGSPWQPRFHNWAFNVDRNSPELDQIWSKIPEDTDILLTHGPGWGYLDRVVNTEVRLGCELLARHVSQRVVPRIHACGHIHTGRGIYSNGKTTYINGSVLNERYDVSFKPIVIELNNTGTITLVDV